MVKNEKLIINKLPLYTKELNPGQAKLLIIPLKKKMIKNDNQIPTVFPKKVIKKLSDEFINLLVFMFMVLESFS